MLSPPEDLTTDVGAIINQDQLQRVLDFIAEGRADGGKILTGEIDSQRESSRRVYSSSRQLLFTCDLGECR